MIAVVTKVFHALTVRCRELVHWGVADVLADLLGGELVDALGNEGLAVSGERLISGCHFLFDMGYFSFSVSVILSYY